MPTEADTYRKLAVPKLMAGGLEQRSAFHRGKSVGPQPSILNSHSANASFTLNLLIALTGEDWAICCS